MNRVLVAALAALLVFVWMFRWSDPQPVGDDNAYVIDRWTGSIWAVYGVRGGLARVKITQDLSKELGQ